MSEMRIIGLEKLKKEEREALYRRGTEVSQASEKAKCIIEEVRKGGDEAVIECERKFSGIEIEKLEVGEEEVKEAFAKIDKRLLKVMERAKRNIEKFHKMQMPKEFEIEIEKGVRAGRMVVPLETAGLYVPAGKAVYPSVALMLSIPAKIAGVKEIVACSPAGKDGKMNEATIVALKMCGVNRIFKCGGAQAIAAMALGTETIPKVDVIAGPGGPFVAAAQMLLKDEVKIEFLPGPSEGMVLADGTADAKIVAADVLSEAEHGPDSAGVLVTDSRELAEKVKKEFEEMVALLPEERRKYVEKNMEKYSFIALAEDFEDAVRFANEYAVEHLQINCKNPEEVARKIRNAGTICIGKYSPITAGNFIAGPNAVLPTSGFARRFSGVSVETFLKKPTIEIISREGLEGIRKDLEFFAEFEGFPAHANSVKVRFEK